MENEIIFFAIATIGSISVTYFLISFLIEKNANPVILTVASLSSIAVTYNSINLLDKKDNHPATVTNLLFLNEKSETAKK